jgi:lysophospholipase L1-like esterase
MKKWVVVGFALMLLAGTAHGATKRILILGDSWTLSLTAENKDNYPSQDLFDQQLVARGFGPYETQGALTAWGGRKASDWAKPANLATIVSELQTYPDIDIVHVIIGGNDFLAVATNGTLVAATPAQRQVIWDGIIANITTIVNTALGVRPSIRVVLADYDYLNMTQATAVWGMNFYGASVANFNSWFVELGQRKKQLADATARVEYVQNWGTLQYWFGTPAQAVPYPGQAPNFTPFPGGDPTLPMPLGVSPDGIHPNDAAHVKMLGNAFDAFYTAWLTPADEEEEDVSSEEVTSLSVPLFSE